MEVLGSRTIPGSMELRYPRLLSFDPDTCGNGMAEDDLGKLCPSQRGSELRNSHIFLGSPTTTIMLVLREPNLVMPIDNPASALNATVLLILSLHRQLPLGLYDELRSSQCFEFRGCDLMLPPTLNHAGFSQPSTVISASITTSPRTP